MLPWPPLAGAFLDFAAEEDGVEVGVSFFVAAGGASSSEKDSQPGS